MSQLTQQHKSVGKLSPLQLYLKEISRYPLLTPEEEYDLAKVHYESGDPKAAHRLITSNLRLVVKIASDFRKIRGELLDLIQEGNTGLMQAVKRFNPYKGVRLSSYAVWWIRAYILKFLLDNEKQVKIATTSAQRKLFYNLRQETEKLLKEYNRADTKMISERLQVPERDIVEMQKRMSATDIRLDAPLSGEAGRNITAGDLMADVAQKPIDALVADVQLKSLFREHIKDFMKDLPPRDHFIFTSRILSESPLTLQQLGDEYNITRERARQIEARIINNLRKFLIAKGLLEVSDVEANMSKKQRAAAAAKANTSQSLQSS
ncbi:MAG: RNA polymerase factor sigma-32 [Proteobacteria bacterium]|nr:RNA polymerase factor sigma-32 [Pseudomonadota bacterium]